MDIYQSCIKLFSTSPLPFGIDSISPSIVIDMFAINETKQLINSLLTGVEKLEIHGIFHYI